MRVVSRRRSGSTSESASSAPLPGTSSPPSGVALADDDAACPPCRTARRAGAISRNGRFSSTTKISLEPLRRSGGRLLVERVEHRRAAGCGCRVAARSASSRPSRPAPRASRGSMWPDGDDAQPRAGRVVGDAVQVVRPRRTAGHREPGLVDLGFHVVGRHDRPRSPLTRGA